MLFRATGHVDHLKTQFLTMIISPAQGLWDHVKTSLLIILVWPLTLGDRNSSPNIKSNIESRVQSMVQPRVQSTGFVLSHRRKHRTSCMFNSSYFMYSQFISSPNWRHTIENNSNRPQVHLGIILFSKYNFRCLLVWNQHNIGCPIMGNFPSMVYRTWERHT